jgi:hypothetical protein
VRRWLGAVMVMALATTAGAADGNETAERLRKATTVLTAMVGGGEAVIPRDLLTQASSVVGAWDCRSAVRSSTSSCS